jgi:hypothetical protein
MGPYHATGSSSGFRRPAEANAFRAGLHHDLVAAIEQHQRVILRVVRRRRWDRRRLGQHGLRVRSIAERSGAGEDIGKGIARGLDLNALALAGGTEMST